MDAGLVMAINLIYVDTLSFHAVAMKNLLLSSNDEGDKLLDMQINVALKQNYVQNKQKFIKSVNCSSII